MNNAAPFEIIWAYLLSVAAGNFATELRKSLRHRRSVQAAYEEGELPMDAYQGRMIYATGMIVLYSSLMAMCILFAIPGWYLMTQPQGGPNNTPTVAAMVLGWCFMGGAAVVFALSCGMRYFSRRLGHNVRVRARETPKQ